MRKLFLFLLLAGMSFPQVKISSLATASSVDANTLFYVMPYSGGTYISRKYTLGGLTTYFNSNLSGITYEQLTLSGGLVLGDLSPALKAYIGSGGNVVNMPDLLALTMKPDSTITVKNWIYPSYTTAQIDSICTNATGTVTFKAGTYTPTAGHTYGCAVYADHGAVWSDSVKFTNTFDGDLSQHFSVAVNMTNANIKEVYPEWWGAKGDGTTDDSQAIQNAINSFFKKIILSAKTYIINKSLAILSYTQLQGTNTGYTTIKQGNSFSGMALLELDGTADCEGVIIENLQLQTISVRAIGYSKRLSDIAGYGVSNEFNNIRLNAKNGIILDLYTQANLLTNIKDVSQIGVDTLIYVHGNVNTLENIDKEGQTGSANGAYIYITNNNLPNEGNANILKNIIIEGTTSANKSGMIFRGARFTKLDGYWYEPTSSDGYCLRLEGCQAQTWIEGNLNLPKKLKIDSSGVVYINSINVWGVTDYFYDNVIKDANSIVIADKILSNFNPNPFILDSLANHYYFNEIITPYNERFKPQFYGSNFFTNGQFEDSTTNWSLIHTGTAPDSISNPTSDISTGKMLRMVYNTPGSGSGLLSTFQVTTGIIGKEFVLSALVKIDSAGTIAPYINGGGINTTNSVIDVTASGGWAIFTYSFKPTTTGVVWVGFWFYYCKIVNIDDAYLTLRLP